MTVSSPIIPPSSFDPALYLHSEAPDNAAPAAKQRPFLDDDTSTTFSDDLEALSYQFQEKSCNRVVIRHRAWNLSDVFRSEDDARPVTPTRTSGQQTGKTYSLSSHVPIQLPSSPPIPEMPFMSSPVAAGSVSVDSAAGQSASDGPKRGLVDAALPTDTKRQKIFGGFLAEEDEDDDEYAAFGEAHLRRQFEIQEATLERLSSQISAPPLAALSPASQPFTSVDNSATATRSITEDTAQPTTRDTTGTFSIKTCLGKMHSVAGRAAPAAISYERLVAGRSTTAPGRAQKSYYGIDIHKLMDEVANETKSTNAAGATGSHAVRPSIEAGVVSMNSKSKRLAAAMWTEKYRARKFTDLIGDERTHRSVLRWLKGWDPIVFPNLARARPKKVGTIDEEGRSHRKVLLLCGPPGLGKTTLAHVCAKQAGYEVLEINASDDRSKDVVKGRIRDALGTENVKGMNVETGQGKVRKAGRPVCVVVDEVDGVVTGSGGGGEGGFMKALIDLVLLDQKNAARRAEQSTKSGKARKGDTFRFLRPLILICNDVYHPSLRPLRASSVAETIHVRQPPLENVVQRVKAIFAKENVPCENDAARRLCEASWGIANAKRKGSRETGTGEGDLRSVLVAAEWVAHKIRNEGPSSSWRLTKSWLEERVLRAGTEGSTFFKGLSRGGVREIVDRVFTEGAGFTDAPITASSFRDTFDNDDAKMPIGVADLRKRHAINRLREMVDASGEHDRCVTECFASYPGQAYQDDTFLSKPNMAYDWLHFHDSVSSKIYSNQEWELGTYLSQSVLAFHHLFASTAGKSEVGGKNEDSNETDEETHPFSGPRADFAAFEAQKQNRAILTGFQSTLSAPLLRIFRSPDSMTTDLIPNLLRILSPDVKPVVVRGTGDQRSVASVRKDSERALIRLAVRAMTGLSVTFEKVRVENDAGGHGGWAYRMEPPLDSLVSFSKVRSSSLSNTTSAAPVRFAVRQVLDQEYRKETIRKQSGAASTRPLTKSSSKQQSGKPADELDKENSPPAKTALGKVMGVKRDFFGRIINEAVPRPKDPGDGSTRMSDSTTSSPEDERKVWVTFHEGFSNAVRKPISMSELLSCL